MPPSYQVGSPWPHFRGDLNNTGLSSFNGTLTNNTRWILSIPNDYVSTTITISSSESLFMTSYTHTNQISLTSLDLCGKTQWKFTVVEDATYANSSPSIVYDGSIIFAAETTLYSISSTGSINWSFKLNTTFSTSPSIIPGLLNVLVGTSDNRLLSLYCNGSLRWIYQPSDNFNTSTGIYSSAAVGYDFSIYYGSSDFYVYKLSSSGSLIWKYETGSAVISSPAISNDNSIYVGSYDGFIYKFSCPSGIVLWKYYCETSYSSPAIGPGPDNNVYIGSQDSYLYSFTSHGSLLWKFYILNFAWGSPIVDAVGTIFVPCSSLAIFALHPHNGTIIWEYSPNNNVGFQASPSIGSDGTVYIASLSNHVYAFGSPIKLTNSPIYSNASHTLPVALVVTIVIVACSCLILVSMVLYHQYITKLYTRRYSGDYVVLDDEDKESVVSNEILSRGSFSPLPKDIRVPKIKWSDISMSGQDKCSVVGQGSFGIVVKALWTPPTIPLFENVSQKDRIVAIKVLTRSVPGTVSNRLMNHDKVLRSAKHELQMMKAAEERMTYKDCIVKVHGIASGKLTKALCVALNLYEGLDAIGIVMRFEGGGSLQNFIYNRDPSKQYWPLEDKLRVLTAIARGLAELHAVGVVHGDVKPDNVLFSDDNPPQIRLADFGLSTIRAESSLDVSTLSQTSHLRGSPIYCAPEILHNPFLFSQNFSSNKIAEYCGLVAKPSRKTDIYAFALVAWEVLTESVPFAEAKNELMLSTMVHNNDRPPLDLIPTNCPRRVVRLIESCWKSERSERRTAVECYSILSQCYNVMISSNYDIYLSHDSSYLPTLTCAIFHRLTQQGFRVWYDGGTMDSRVTSEGAQSVTVLESVCRSDIFVMVAGDSYQTSKRCMDQLIASRSTKPPKHLVSFLLRTNKVDWASLDFLSLSQSRISATAANSIDTSEFDLEEIAKDPSWNNIEGPSSQILGKLHVIVDDSVKFMRSLPAIVDSSIPASKEALETGFVPTLNDSRVDKPLRADISTHNAL